MAYLSGAAAGGRRPSMAQRGAPRPTTASGRVRAALAADAEDAYASMRAALSSGHASADEEAAEEGPRASLLPFCAISPTAASTRRALGATTFD